jgi:uncharacterized membrane protein SpoIIM required for sporulation
VDLDAYVAEHAGQWQRLEVLATRNRRLSAAEVDEMVELYQRTATHLSAIKSRSPDPALVARLSRLVLLARGAITGTSRFRWSNVGRFFTHTFPGEVYRARVWWISVSLSFVAAWYALMEYFATHPQAVHVYLSDAKIQSLVDHDFAAYYSANAPQNFALEVWTNNAWLTAQCLASGILIVPVLWLLWNNLLNVSLIGGVMQAHGYTSIYLGLLAPHGLLELTSVFIGAGAGLRMGWAWIAPGPSRTRGQALVTVAYQGMMVALGLVGVLAVSGFLEAFVTPAPIPLPMRDAIGFVVWSLFLVYVFVLGRRALAETARGQGSAADVLDVDDPSDAPA